MNCILSLLLLLFLFCFHVSSIFRKEHFTMFHSPQIATSGNKDKFLIKNRTCRIYIFMLVPGSTRRRSVLFFLGLLCRVYRKFWIKINKNLKNTQRIAKMTISNLKIGIDIKCLLQYYLMVHGNLQSWDERWLSCFPITKFSKERIW